MKVVHKAYADADPLHLLLDNANRTPWCCTTTSTRHAQLIYRQRIIYPPRVLSYLCVGFQIRLFAGVAHRSVNGKEATSAMVGL